MNDDLARPGTAPSPDVSVVVVFYNRLNFLPAALASVLDQTVAKDRYEVLVVGPGRPPDLVERSSGPVVRYVECTEVGLGSKIAKGIREARGGVVAFLEDDDLYEREKLEFVRESFASDPNLSFLQNGYRTIDEEGRWIARPGPDERAMARWTARGRVEVPGRPSESDLHRLVRIPAGFNNSSIAVRRVAVEPHLGLVERVDMLVDITLLYGALVQAGHVVLDPRPLTRLRKHARSNSDPRLQGETEQLDRLLVFANAAQERRRLLFDYVRARGSPALVRAVEGQWAMNEVFRHLRDPQYGFADRARVLVKSLCTASTFEARNYLPAIPLLALTLPLGRSGPRFYIRVRRRFYLQSP